MSSEYHLISSERLETDRMSCSGLHQPEEPVQARVFYLFSRFLYQAKSIVQAQLSGDVISNILGRMQVSLVLVCSSRVQVLTK
jgi:hypothetical protein